MTIRLADLTLVAQGRTVAAAIGFEVRAGETTCLLGPSGCGKTSAALWVVDLLPRGLAAASGAVFLDEKRLDERGRRALRGSTVGMIFQDPRRSLHPDFSVGKQLAAVLIAGGSGRAEARREVLRWLERVGIDEPTRRAQDHPHAFSGGELQRIVTAMALAGRPRFLFADEPTSNLDVTVQGRMLGLLRRLQREEGMGLLLITHDVRVERAFADQTVRVAPPGVVAS